MNKKNLKRLNKCCFCEENRYELLDVHRILQGSQGGKYNSYNSLVLCASCHRKVHSNIIVIQDKRFCSNGTWLVFYTEDGQEKIAEIL